MKILRSAVVALTFLSIQTSTFQVQAKTDSLESCKRRISLLGRLSKISPLPLIKKAGNSLYVFAFVSTSDVAEMGQQKLFGQDTPPAELIRDYIKLRYRSIPLSKNYYRMSRAEYKQLLYLLDHGDLGLTQRSTYSNSEPTVGEAYQLIKKKINDAEEQFAQDTHAEVLDPKVKLASSAVRQTAKWGTLLIGSTVLIAATIGLTSPIESDVGQLSYNSLKFFIPSLREAENAKAQDLAPNLNRAYRLKNSYFGANQAEILNDKAYVENLSAMMLVVAREDASPEVKAAVRKMLDSWEVQYKYLLDDPELGAPTKTMIAEIRKKTEPS